MTVALKDGHNLWLGRRYRILEIDPTDPDHLTMVLYNADGSRAEMSGNGMRTLAWVAARDGAIVATGHGSSWQRLDLVPGTVVEWNDKEGDGQRGYLTGWACYGAESMIFRARGIGNRRWSISSHSSCRTC